MHVQLWICLDTRPFYNCLQCQCISLLRNILHLINSPQVGVKLAVQTTTRGFHLPGSVAHCLLARWLCIMQSKVGVQGQSGGGGGTRCNRCTKQVRFQHPKHDPPKVCRKWRASSTGHIHPVKFMYRAALKLIGVPQLSFWTLQVATPSGPCWRWLPPQVEQAHETNRVGNQRCAGSRLSQSTHPCLHTVEAVEMRVQSCRQNNLEQGGQIKIAPEHLACAGHIGQGRSETHGRRTTVSTIEHDLSPHAYFALRPLHSISSLRFAFRN